MIQTRAFLTFVVLGPLVLGIALLSSRAADAADGQSGATDGPVLVAQLPPKPESKKYNLQYKLTRGDVLRYDVSHKASIRSTIDTTTQTAQTKTDSVKVWKVTDVLPDGNIEFMNVVERVHMVNQLPDRSPTEYDSIRDKTPPPGYEDAARAVGVPISSVQITPQGKIVRRVMKIQGQGAEDDAPIVLRLPDQPVAVGETWDESFEVQVKLQKNGSKQIQTRRHHRLTEVKNGIATIDVTYQILSPIDAAVEVQIVQRLMSGQVSFDIEKGRVIGQQMDVDKRVLGFAGPTSSMQYVMKMEEKLAKDEPKTAAKPKSKKTAGNQSPSRTPQTANRPKTQQQQQQNKTYRR